MRIENEMLSRFNSELIEEKADISLSGELDIFFNNVLDTVVEYFTERTEIRS